jgi:acetoin utilization protein AcuB
MSAESGTPTHQFPTVRQYMTASPLTISRAQPLSNARRLMVDQRVRHLPVLDGEEVIGLLSERDVLLAESLPGVNPTELRVEEAMTEGACVVGPDAPLGEAVQEMIRRKIGSVVVVDDGRVSGVLTTVDALRALADLLEAR